MSPAIQALGEESKRFLLGAAEEENEDPRVSCGAAEPSKGNKKKLKVAVTPRHSLPSSVDVTRPPVAASGDATAAVDAFLTFVGSSSPLGVTDPSFANNLGSIETAT